MILIKSKEEIRKMAKASEIVAGAIEAIRSIITAGVTTKELEQVAEDIIRSRGGIPAFKGYRGYPASICTSVNDEVVHGIPSVGRKLEEGDIVSIDLGVIYKGYIGDAAVTIPVGKITDEIRRLLQVTEQSLYAGIEKARANNRLTDISNAIQRFVESNGYSVVRAFVGHGVGRALHEDPQIPNFGPPGKGPRLKPGMTIAIEPMVNEGTHEVFLLDDGWTAKTSDGKLSAHFEHTIVIYKDGAEILTKW
ncbi:MAG TPA: type I methionyl aminopeptidase [Nitrospirae bacterium]|nr:type I methionyl aminopeptidase [Nitrospirota bacterium]HDY72152.1 type I methionyl aminopeptidase [Nitrospirota bacterium]